MCVCEEHSAVVEDGLGGVGPQEDGAVRTLGATLVLVEVLHEAGLTEGVKTLRYGVRVTEVPGTKPADQVRVDARHLRPTRRYFDFRRIPLILEC